MVKTMKEQAAERGLPVPVGKTAGELRKLGWAVSVDVPDAAVLTNEPSSGSTLELDVPADCSWLMTVHDRIFWLAYHAEAVMETPELHGRLPLLVGDLVEHLGWLVDKAQNEDRMTLSRYYRVLQNFAKTLGQ